GRQGVETKRAVLVFGNQGAIAQRSSPGLASNRATATCMRCKPSHPSPSARQFRLLLNGLAASALRRMFCSDEGACVRFGLPAGFIEPCLPTKTEKLPSGDLWLHEIKHDGFRIIARKDGDRVRLYSRPGNDLTGASSFHDLAIRPCCRHLSGSVVTLIAAHYKQRCSMT